MSTLCLRLLPIGGSLYARHLTTKVLTNFCFRSLSNDYHNRRPDQQQNDTTFDTNNESQQQMSSSLLPKTKRIQWETQSKRRNILKEINTKVKYEDQFQDHRRHNLSPICVQQYQQWLIDWCHRLGVVEKSTNFVRRYRKIVIICDIYNEILNTTFRVPVRLTTDHLRQLMQLDLHREIREQIHYWYDLEFKKYAQKLMQKEQAIENSWKLEMKHTGRTSRIGIFDAKNPNEIVYGLWHNTLFTRINPRVRRELIAKTRLKNAALFGQKVVIDFSFEEHLNELAAKQLLGYLSKMFTYNKNELNESFDITFCSLNPYGIVKKYTENYFHKSLYECYINVTQDSYLNHFDVNRLCYICPQADEPLVKYDNNMVYIIPGVVQHLMNPPLSMMRVRQEGIQMKRIPLEEYGTVREGFHLEVSNTLEILSFLRDYGDMETAIKMFLPNSVWKSDDEITEKDEEVIRRMFYLRKIAAQSTTKMYRAVD